MHPRSLPMPTKMQKNLRDCNPLMQIFLFFYADFSKFYDFAFFLRQRYTCLHLLLTCLFIPENFRLTVMLNELKHLYDIDSSLTLRMTNSSHKVMAHMTGWCKHVCYYLF